MKLIDDKSAHRLSDALRIIATPTRMRIFQLLSDGPKSIPDLAAPLGIQGNIISQNLTWLRMAGFVVAIGTKNIRTFALVDGALVGLAEQLADLVSRGEIGRETEICLTTANVSS